MDGNLTELVYFFIVILKMDKKNINQPVSIILPVYNEEGEIKGVLKELVSVFGASRRKYEIIIVDDASSDKSAQLIGGFGAKIIKHEKNKGYGAALKTGIRKAKYDIIAICDADGTYPVGKIPELVSYIGKYDMAVGARKGATVNMPLARKPAKWFLSKYANYLTKEDIPDINSGLRAFKKDVFERFQNILPSGFSFTTTITLALLSNDYQVKYIDIDYYKRGGQSKIKPIRDTVNFFSLITRTSLYFNPLRIFMPVALFLLAVGFGVFIYSIIVFKNISDITLIIFLWGVQLAMIGLLADMISRQQK